MLRPRNKPTDDAALAVWYADRSEHRMVLAVRWAYVAAAGFAVSFVAQLLHLAGVRIYL